MLQEALVGLHAGQGPVTGPEYLVRVLLTLLAFATVAVGARFGLGVADAVRGADAQRESTERDDD